jgi:ZIP family zinc transporter
MNGGAAVVGAFALATALATGLGALPFVLMRGSAERWLGAGNAVAGGVMLGASASLLLDGASRSGVKTATGAAAGALFVVATYHLLGERDAVTLGSLSGVAAKQALVIVVVMTAHSAAEGIGVGAAFADGDAFGVLIALAIAVQNIPEGLAISLVLVPRGTTVRAAAGWSVFSSLPQPLLAVPAFLFVDRFTTLLPAALGFAAGAMVWMVARSLLPEALAHAPTATVVAATSSSFGVMLALQFVLLG